MATKTPAWQKAYLNQYQPATPASPKPSFQVGSQPQAKYTPPAGMQETARSFQPTLGAQQPTAAQPAAEPSWTDKLTSYSTDPNAAKTEYQRANQVFNAKTAIGDTEGAAGANKWMGQVNTATGGMAAPKPNDGLEPYMKAYLDNVNKPVTPFRYDPQNDLSYKSQKAILDEDLRKGMANARVEAGSSGLRGGSLQNNQLSQLAQQSESRLQNEVIPGLRNQAFGEYQDAINQDRNKNNDLMNYVTKRYGMNQDEIVNKRTDTQNAFTNNLATNADKRATQGQDFSQGVTKAGLSGYYGDASGVKQRMDANSAAWANASPEEQQRLHDDNLKLGASIGSTYDPQTGEYSAPQGLRTMAGQAQDFSQGLQSRDQQLQETQVMSQLTGMLPDGTPTTAEQQRLLANEWKFADSQGVIGEKLGEMYNLPANTPTQAAKAQAAQIAISQQNANTSAFSASNSAANARASQNLNERKFQADQDPNSIDNRYKLDQMKSKEDQTMYDNGLKAYKDTGAMPDYMTKFGINVQGLKNEKTKAEVQGLYGELSSGKLTPEDAIKTINDAEKLGLKDPEVINQLRKTIYLQFPEYDPAEIAAKKAVEDKPQHFGYRMFGG